ncbi:MAG: bacteriohemerythrin [Candidatus Gastranaerophilales bacterium]|nr:bacteriohemerythrin [Candidatus Gastranaerophilales bacterium]
MPIEWNDKLKTGIPLIDEEHQELIVMLTRIGRFRCGAKSFEEALNELHAYVKTHFKTEEDYMISANYPEYEDHKACHDKLIKDLDFFLQKKEQNESIYEMGVELSNFVGEWIVNHYSDEDVKLADYIKTRP